MLSILWWIFLGVVAVVVWIVWASRELCPVCGAQLRDSLGYPGTKTDHCWRCQWKRSRA